MIENTVDNLRYTIKDMSEPCLNGVRYIMREINGKGALAPKFNSKTQKVNTCSSSLGSELTEKDFSISCIANVNYYTRSSGTKLFIATKYNPDSSISVCGS